jgi:hypothetical protein
LWYRISVKYGRPRFTFIEFDEDALTGAHLCCANHRLSMPFFDSSKTPRTTRIIQHLARLTHIGDAILQLNEHVVTVVDTQAITSAKVLVDPHAHP